MALKDLNGHRTGRPLAARTDPANCAPITQAIAIQRRVARMALRDDTTPAVLASLARSWTLIDARLSAHRMKPLPKSVDVTKYHAARAAARKAGHSKHAQPSEPKPEPTAETTPSHAQPTATTPHKESLSQPDRHPGGEGEGAEATGADDETPT